MCLWKILMVNFKFIVNLTVWSHIILKLRNTKCKCDSYIFHTKCALIFFSSVLCIPFDPLQILQLSSRYNPHVYTWHFTHVCLVTRVHACMSTSFCKSLERNIDSGKTAWKCTNEMTLIRSRDSEGNGRLTLASTLSVLLFLYTSSKLWQQMWSMMRFI